MTDDPWGVDELEEPVEEATLAAEPRQCGTCGRLPLHEDPRASALLLERIRTDARDRLVRSEAALGLLGEADRIAVARWLTSVLERPPLAGNRVRSFAPIVAVLDALWHDIYWTTPDALSPAVGGDNGRVVVPHPHEELREMREGWIEP